MKIHQPVEHYREVLPDVLKPDDLTTSREFLESVTLDYLRQTAIEGLRTFEYHGRPFRMAVVEPTEEKDETSAVATFTEFGTALPPRFVAKSLLVRRMANPNAALVMQPNSVVGEDNMNFSSEERSQLWHGNPAPLIGRMAVVMDRLNNPDDITLSGISQGATVALAYAASPDAPATAVSAMEIPSVMDRTKLQMGIDFMFRSGFDLQDVVRANFDNLEAPLAQQALKDAGPSGLLHFFTKVISPNTLALMGTYTNPMAKHDILETLKKGGSVVHSNGDTTQVSPEEANQEIADSLQGTGGYRHYLYQHRLLKGMGHTATDFYVLSAALAREARQVKQSL